jgi:ABC-type transport system involved in multi-copper enzyme maturation permease subunit
MGLRLGPGPVFAYEWLTSTRRWQLYALRTVFIGLILIGMTLVHATMLREHPNDLVSLRSLATYAEQMYRTVVSLELTLVLLAAPAATAGAVCLDKARGTLDHMLATDLSNAEIVLGKLGVRLIPVLGLIACMVPVLALAGLLGGIDPLGLLGSFLVAIGCAFAGCSLAMTLSVYGRKTHEVLIMTYLIVILWVMAPPLVELVHQGLVGGSPPRAVGVSLWGTLHDWAEWSNPYSLVYEPYSNPGKIGVGRFLGFLAACLLFAAGLTGLSTARIRVVASRQAGRPAARAGWRLPRLPRLPRLTRALLDFNPVAWREWHRTRPSLMMRVAWGLYTALGLLWVWLASVPSRSRMGDEGIPLMNMFQVSVGLLLLSVSAATSLAEERVRGSLDVLLSTPMSTRSILAGKWWGTFRGVLRVVIWPAATTLFLVADDGRWSGYLLLLGLLLAYGAAITSLGLAVATWVSRLGRAIALCVTVYVLLVIGFPILLVLCLGDRMDSLGMALILGDPPYGAAFVTMAASSRGTLPAQNTLTPEDLLRCAVIWFLVYSVVAASLFRATLATFDRCLGRIPDDVARPPSSRPRRSSLTPAELLALVPSGSEDEYDEEQAQPLPP